MSHIVRVQTKVRDGVAVRAACRRRGLPDPVEGRHLVFRTQLAGLGVKLRGWTYPVVCQLQDGQVQYDNFNGRWGDVGELNLFLQAYAVEKARLEARRQGHRVSEQALADGSIKLVVHVGGAA